MNLPKPDATYSQQNEAQARSEMEREDVRNQKRGSNVELSGDSAAKSALILKSPNGTRYRVLVDNSGALSTTPA